MNDEEQHLLDVFSEFVISSVGSVNSVNIIESKHQAVAPLTEINALQCLTLGNGKGKRGFV